MAIDFRPVDPLKPVRVYRRNLPHWRQDGATYFVTFRLFDSLPAPMLKNLAWLRRMLLAAKDSDDQFLKADRAYYLKYKEYLDRGFGACWLRKQEVKEVVEAALDHFAGNRYQLGELAVMPNHVHALVRPLADHELGEILHSWKSYTAKRILQIVDGEHRVWQDESYDRLVRDHTELARIETYIEKNRASSVICMCSSRDTGGTPVPRD